MNEPSGEYESKFIKNHYGSNAVDIKLAGRETHAWNGSLAHTLMQLHDGIGRTDVDGNPLSDTGKPPKVIFATAISSIPYTFAIKECWKTAYPHEKPPKIYFIDVRDQTYGHTKESLSKLYGEDIESIDTAERERLSQIGTRNNAFEDAVVFDEFTYTGHTFTKVNELLKQVGYTNINFLHGRWGHTLTQALGTETLPVVRRERESIGKAGIPYRRLKGNSTKDSRELVRDMRRIGRKMGEEITKHLPDIKTE